MSKQQARPRPAGRIAFVQSRWHKSIVDQCRHAFTAEMARNGVARRAITVFEVPGAFEIPLMAKIIAGTGRYGAIVAAGLVVDGGIYRHDFVAGSVVDALMRLQLETETPIISAVLTPLRFHDHEEHRRFFHDHFLVKGKEAASACIATMANMGRLKRASAAAGPY
jgi:6,7-dimethyl-8-ribityllumazine synthase